MSGRAPSARLVPKEALKDASLRLVPRIWYEFRRKPKSALETIPFLIHVPNRVSLYYSEVFFVGQ